MKRVLFFIAMAIFCLVSCSRVSLESADDAFYAISNRLNTKSAADIEIPYVNPYSLSVMQAALDTLVAIDSLWIEDDAEEEIAIELEATDYYVRIQPRDSAEFMKLYEMGIELFPFPLDRDIEGDVWDYQDPGVTDCDFPWYYSVLKPEMFETVPDYSDVLDGVETGEYYETTLACDEDGTLDFQVLDCCYIPEDDVIDDGTAVPFSNNMEIRQHLPVSADRLERMAYTLSGYEVPIQARISSDGTIHGYAALSIDRSDDRRTPIKGMQLKVWRFVKIRTAYTDDRGYFEFDAKFGSDPKIMLVGKNLDGVNIWRNIKLLTPEYHSIGSVNQDVSNTLTVNKDDNAWNLAAIGTASYEYYRHCEEEGISVPSGELWIDCLTAIEKTGAPMLRHALPSTKQAFINILKNQGAGLINLLGLASVPLSCFYFDLYIASSGFSLLTYQDVKSVLYHELSHASHYSIAGDLFWHEYIMHILSAYDDSPYGNGSLGTLGESICELGESWAEANSKLVGYNNLIVSNVVNWFDGETETMYELMRSGLLTSGEIFRALNSNVTSMDLLYSSLVQQYRSKMKDILDIFVEHIALTGQSQLQILNSSAQTIRVVSDNDQYLISPGESKVIHKAPQMFNSFTQMMSQHSYSPNFMYIAVGTGGGNCLLYYEGGGLQMDIQKSFFNNNNWITETETNPLRSNKHKRTFTFEITNSDISF